MKKTLSVLAILGVISFCGAQQANAFSWSNLNPANWGRCSKCEQPKSDCGCKTKVDKDCPCTTGAAAPCKPCTHIRFVILAKKNYQNHNLAMLVTDCSKKCSINKKVGLKGIPFRPFSLFFVDSV